jgi:hypothetical protein
MAIVLPVVLTLLVSGCQYGAKKNPTQHERSARLGIQATGVAPGASVRPDNIPINGGILNIQSASVSIGAFVIQENSGDNNGGDSSGLLNEPDSSDITVSGPFALEIARGETFVESVAVYPGTFKQLTASFSTGAQPPFNGSSIIVQGTYTPEGGSGIPVILQSAYNQETECLIAGGGITAPRDTTVALVAVFDLVGWFSDVDFAHAQVSNGQILVDSTHNSGLLAAFESNLENSGGGGQQGEH